jgi:hypothetical protein
MPTRRDKSSLLSRDVHGAVPPSKRGKPLESEVRSFFEPRFGHDFGRVRVHSGEQAAELARGVNARAYAVGNDIVLGAHQDVSTPGGMGLLAHELAHVVQQSRGGPSGDAESGAQAAVNRLARGLAAPAEMVGGAPPGLYRQGTEETPPSPVDPRLLPSWARTPHLAEVSPSLPKAPMPSPTDKPLLGPRAKHVDPVVFQSLAAKKAPPAAAAPETLTIPGTARFIKMAIRLSPPSPDIKQVDGKIPDAYVKAAINQALDKARLTGNQPPGVDKGDVIKTIYSIASTYFLADLTAKLAAAFSSKEKGSVEIEFTLNIPDTSGGASTVRARYSGAGFQALSGVLFGIGGKF